jgi:serine/threonine protein phosphatase PrpC
VQNGRVSGSLSLSRALGDLDYKKNPSLRPEQQLISPMPDVRKYTYGPSDKFLVMGCDGIWELLTVEDICVYTDTGLKAGKRPVEIAEEIMDKGVSPDTSGGGSDNMSCIVIELNK